jgi:hypothetical protein
LENDKVKPILNLDEVEFVRGGGKVGHWSGGLVPLRAE